MGLVLASGVLAQQQQTPVPDAPTPQAPPPLPGAGPITPGIGSGGSSHHSKFIVHHRPAAGATRPAAHPLLRSSQSSSSRANRRPRLLKKAAPRCADIIVQVNFVQVPVTVKDSKGNPVSGLTWRDFTVYENSTREPLRVFSVDPEPLSIAFVIDQTLPSNVMDEVNRSMGSIQGALAPYDEAAVFTYTNGAKEWTGFTGAQSTRLPAVLSLAQATGSDPMVPVTGGDPFAACAISINGNCAGPQSAARQVDPDDWRT